MDRRSQLDMRLDVPLDRQHGTRHLAHGMGPQSPVFE